MSEAPITTPDSTSTSHVFGTNNQYATSEFLLAFLTALGFTMLLSHAILCRFKVTWLSEASCAIFLGAFFGGILGLIPGEDVETMKEKGSFFFFNMVKILTFAVIGTFISAWIFGVFLWCFGKIGTTCISVEFSFPEALTFGALISATDPVTTLAIFDSLKVDPHLFYIVFGESVLNDAVSIVLYHTFAKFIGTTPKSGTALFAILDFFLIFFGSTAVGVICGCFLELSVFVIFAYVPFLLGEWLSLSGIVAILFTGITMKHYTYNNMSRNAREKSDTIIAVLANISETAIFLNLGSSMWNFNSFHFAHIYPMSFILNKCTSRSIAKNQQHMLWFSGLRGAIAYALAMNFPSEHKDYVISTTIIIVFVTVVFFGGATDFLLNWLRIPRGPQTFQASHERSMVQFVSTNRIVRFDRRYIQPILLRRRGSRKVKQNLSMIQLDTEEDTKKVTEITLTTNSSSQLNEDKHLRCASSVLEEWKSSINDSDEHFSSIDAGDTVLINKEVGNSDSFEDEGVYTYGVIEAQTLNGST
eukprot:GSMAST32.ASY1.ANO1.533.1 assembled CDS